MRIKIQFVSMFLLISSCATILHRKQYEVYVHSNHDNSKVVYADTIFDLPSKITINRSKSNLNLILLNDTIRKEYTIKSSLTRSFLLYNLFWNYAAPFAYAIDYTTPKRFYYGDEIYFNKNDTSSVLVPKYRKRYVDYFYVPYPTEKKQLYLFLSLPYLNSFHMKPMGENPKINAGFWGLSIGMEYFYKRNKYISLNANWVTDFFVPFPASPGIDGIYEVMNSGYFSISDNFKFNRFTFGYGLCYAHNIWKVTDYGYDDPVEINRKSHNSLGAVFNGYHRISRDLFLGVIYRPTFLNLQNTNDLTYEHLISLSIGWKVKIKG